MSRAMHATVDLPRLGDYPSMPRPILEIYRTYGAPTSLQEHMFRVAGIADLILDHWHGPAVDRAQLLRVLLVHDIGNLVKIDLDESQFLSEDDRKRFPYLLRLQNEYRSKFGRDDHRASLALAKEIGLSQAELTLMDQKILARNPETLASRDFARKIGAYSDQRSAPFGVTSLDQRFADSMRRYHDRPRSPINHPLRARFIECAKLIEVQVLENSDLDETDISEEAIAPYVRELRQWHV